MTILFAIAIIATADYKLDIFSHERQWKCKHCCLLITFANSLDPDQARQDVGPDLDPHCLKL